MSEIMYWGYLHSNGSIIVKRWFGDTEDYTTDCNGNPFVKKVVSPFIAADRESATKIITERINQ